MSNFPSLKWPQLPDVPKNGITIKLRSTQEKKEEYRSFEEESFRNKSRISVCLKALVDAAGNVSAVKKVKAMASVMSDVVKATTEVGKKFDEYSQLVNTSIVEIEKIEDEIQGITTTLKVATTSSTPLSSSTSSISLTTSTSTVPLTTTTSTTPSTTTSEISLLF